MFLRVTLGMSNNLRRAAAVGDGGALEGAEHVVQREGMDAPDTVVERGGGVPVLVGRFVVLIRLLAGTGQGLAVAQPVVLPRGSVDVLRQVVVVIGGEDEVETFHQEVALAVLQRGDKRVALAVFLPEDDVLVDACLYLLVIIGPGEAQHQAVGPGLACHAQLANHRLVVEAVVESLDVVNLAGVGVLGDAVVAELGDVVVDVIVVVRQVLEGVNLIREAVLQCLAEAGVRLVGVERAIRVGGIQVPALALFGGDDIDHAAQRVRAEAHGNHAFVDLDALGIVHRQVVEVERLPCPFLRHPINEDLDMAAAEAVQHQLHVRAHAATLAELHARSLGQGVAQGLGGIVQLGGIHGHGVVGRTLHAAHAGSGDHHLIQLAVFGAEGEVLHEVLTAAQGDFFFDCLIADG